MELTICNYPISRKLKQLGFNYPQHSHYNPVGELIEKLTGLFEIDCYAPTQALAKKFLLDTYNLHIEAKPFERYSGKNCYTLRITHMNYGSDGNVYVLWEGKSPYEDIEICERDGIEQAVAIVIENKFHTFRKV